MNKTPAISIIIPTKNVASIIEPCLESIQAQTFEDYEVILIDNYSDDCSEQIIKKYPFVRFFEHGPERHAQRRFGVEQARGKNLLFIDADMQLDPELLSECDYILKTQKNTHAIIIPERPIGAPNFWTQCKILERSLYAGDDQIEAARFFRRAAYEDVGGFDTDMIAMEDWDLTKKIRDRGYSITRTQNCLSHDEGYVTLSNIWKKKRYYGSESTGFIAKNGITTVLSKIYFFRPVFYKNLSRIFRQPTLGIGMMALLTVEMIAAGMGIMDRTISLAKIEHD